MFLVDFHVETVLEWWATLFHIPVASIVENVPLLWMRSVSVVVDSLSPIKRLYCIHVETTCSFLLWCIFLSMFLGSPRNSFNFTRKKFHFPTILINFHRFKLSFIIMFIEFSFSLLLQWITWWTCNACNVFTARRVFERTQWNESMKRQSRTREIDDFTIPIWNPYENYTFLRDDITVPGIEYYFSVFSRIRFLLHVKSVVHWHVDYYSKFSHDW